MYVKQYKALNYYYYYFKLCDRALSFSSDADFTRHSSDGEGYSCAGQISNCQLNSFVRVYRSLTQQINTGNCIFSERFVSEL